VGRGEGERPQEGRIGEREDRAVGADTECQSHHRDDRKRRCCLQLAHGKLHVVSGLFEPLRELHLTLSLSAKVDACAFEAPDITQPADSHLAGNPRIGSTLDQFACAHLDMEGELLVDFLIDRHAPEPRPK
jgi:hypothetical protein